MINGVIRLLVGRARGMLAAERRYWFDGSPFGRSFSHWSEQTFRATPDLRLVSRFDSEWRQHSRVGSPEQQQIFEQYFDVVPADAMAVDRLTLDAGCGAGRWAHELQRRGCRVIAMDLGQSVEVAEENTRAGGRVACVTFVTFRFGSSRSTSSIRSAFSITSTVRVT